LSLFVSAAVVPQQLVEQAVRLDGAQVLTRSPEASERLAVGHTRVAREDRAVAARQRQRLQLAWPRPRRGHDRAAPLDPPQRLEYARGRIVHCAELAGGGCGGF